MSIELHPQVANLMFWAFTAFAIMAGLIAAAVAMTAHFRKVMNPTYDA